MANLTKKLWQEEKGFFRRIMEGKAKVLSVIVKSKTAIWW